MATTGIYSKAYALKCLRTFSGRTEQAANARPAKPPDTDQPDEAPVPRPLTDDTVVYLHENSVVTDSIFKDEHIIFDNVTPEWNAYCQHHLQFEIPEYLRTEAGQHE